MDFSRIARQLSEYTELEKISSEITVSPNRESMKTAAASSEKAKNASTTNRDRTRERQQSQKAQMSTQKSTPQKSDVTFASEEARRQREIESNMHKQKSDWRTELYEAAKPDDEGNHPYIDVMPFMDQKERETKRQLKGAVKAEAGEKMAEGALNPFQIHFDKDGKEFTSKGSKEARERLTRNRQEMAKRRAKDAYKPRAGESD